MIESLALMILVGLSLAALMTKLKLPRIVGYLLTGILLGPYALNWLDPSVLNNSTDLCQIALLIILVKAGFSVDLADLKRVGRPAALLSFVPASFEMLTYALLAPRLFGISQVDALVMAAVISAVSPAVVVTKMVGLVDQGYGTEKSIPQMILTGASCDNVFVIVLFTTFTHIAKGGSAQVMDFVNIPLSILLGVLLGSAVGWGLANFFETAYARKHYVRNSMKTLIIMGAAFGMIAIQNALEGKVTIAGMLSIISMAFVIKAKSTQFVSKRLADKLGKLWICAEIILFVLVGTEVDIRYTMKAGIMAVVIIFLALVMRSIGVLLCLIGTPLNRKERLFTVISYLPKATVQAAIGAVPLGMGLGCGQLVLTVAVLSILITAPLGAIAIDSTYKRLLTHDKFIDQERSARAR